jgi:hypothetical protein
MKARNYAEQPAPTMIREHFTKSLKEVHGGLRAWVLERPAWLQPPLMGALLVYGFVLWRGGLIVLPVAALTFVFGSPRDRAFFGPLLLAVLVYAPAAGFVGGLIYAFAKPISNRLGGFGKYLKFILGAWAYSVVLIFFIMPVLRPTDRMSLSDPAGWVLSMVVAVVFGLALGAQSVDEAPRTPVRRLSKHAIVLMWAGVVVCQVGWVGVHWAGQWPALVGFVFAFGSLFIGLLVTGSWFSASSDRSEQPNQQPGPPRPKPLLPPE